MKKIKYLAVIMLMCITVTALVACNKKNDKTDWEYIQSKGELIVGLDNAFPPFGFVDGEGKLGGFDIDFANAVGEELGIKITFKSIDWAGKEMELSTKMIDCIWSGFVITDLRKETLNFSIPYTENKGVVVVLNDSNLRTLTDLNGKKLGYQMGSSIEQNIADNAILNGLTKQGFESDGDALNLGLKSGVVEAVACGQIIANYINAQNGGSLFRILSGDGNDISSGSNIGVGFRKGDDQLTNKINDAMRAVKASGKLDEIAMKWFSTADILKVA